MQSATSSLLRGVSAVDVASHPVPECSNSGHAKLSFPIVSLILSILITLLTSAFFVCCGVALVIVCVLITKGDTADGLRALFAAVMISFALTLFHSLLYLHYIAASTSPRTYSSYFRVLLLSPYRLLSCSSHHRLLYLHWYSHGLLSNLIPLDILTLLITVLPIYALVGTQPAALQPLDAVLNVLREALASLSSLMCALVAAEMLLAMLRRCKARRTEAVTEWDKRSVAAGMGVTAVRGWHGGGQWLGAGMGVGSGVDALLTYAPPPYEENEEWKAEAQVEGQRTVVAEGQHAAEEGGAEGESDTGMTAPTILMSPVGVEPIALIAPRLMLSDAMRDSGDVSQWRSRSHRPVEPVPRHAVVHISAL